MDKLLFATLDGTVQINSVTRDKRLYKFEGMIALPNTDEELIVCGTIYNTNEVTIGTLKMPAILNVSAGIIFNAKPVLHVHNYHLRANGDDPATDINPPNIHGVMQILSKDPVSKQYKAKVRTYDRESTNKIESTFTMWRGREHLKNVPYAEEGSIMTFVAQVHSQEPVSSVIKLDLLDSTWTSAPSSPPNGSPSSTTSPGRMKRRRIQAINNPVHTPSPSAPISNPGPSSVAGPSHTPAN
ncbi:hypothetical protein CF319_g9404 [Tilletia indica]|nr:hypothetical protein CF319_g9404 [Tilletia indica]